MNTSYAISSDGSLIAYERYGADPTVILLHDGGGCRQEWREAGYIEHLQNDFTVIPLELRGHGESSPSTNPAAYTVAKMIQNILAVADTCRVEQFTLRGMSYGGKSRALPGRTLRTGEEIQPYERPACAGYIASALPGDR